MRPKRIPKYGRSEPFMKRRTIEATPRVREMQSTRKMSVIRVAPSLFLVACAASSAYPEPPLSQDKVDAATQIAAAADQKVSSCRAEGEVAPVALSRDAISSELDLEDCTTDVREHELARCLAGIRDVSCRHADPRNVTGCRAGAICGVTSEGSI
jgi:hypothetical protein